MRAPTAPRRSSPRRRSGATLLEVLAASIVLALALAPALRIAREAVLAADRLDRQERCLTVANDALEFMMARAAADWDGNVTGTANLVPVVVPGYPGMRSYQLTTDSTTYGGVPGRMAVAGALVWYDDDGDSSPDADEPQALLASGVARMTAYEQQAGS
ncbi:hypothetical protein [Alienimonas sp. DA493]|uniref:hypothetical protein n=1 Tax=Alienimonas sp. DA493 TaxID=3373605 RepID=UPI0037540EE1